MLDDLGVIVGRNNLPGLKNKSILDFEDILRY